MGMQTLTVELGDRSYPVHIGAGLLDGGCDLAPYLASDTCLVVTNDTIGPLYLDRLRPCLGDASVSVISLPDGEAYKTPESANRVIDRLVEMRAGRDATVVALGGGVVGDIAGFAAACYMRGVAFLQVPTTLLSQVDSSVGGKTGVNHPGGKNLIGAFHQPRAVLIDTDSLSTLPERELSAGIAEVIKYGAIIDAEFFAWLERHMPAIRRRDQSALVNAIFRSCELKAEIVAEDEKEAGKRALLNFGHTFGHAIENTMGYGEWLHGEAVAAGMVMAASMSKIAESDQARLRALIDTAGLPVAPPSVGSGPLKEAMRLDKKVQSNRLRFILLRQLGEAYVTSDYGDDVLDAILAGADR